MPAFRRSGIAQQTPLPISFADKRINLFSGNDETCINLTRGQQIIGQFQTQNTDCTISHHSIGSATNSENRSQMTRRGIENGFREKKRTRRLRTGLDNLTIETPRVNDAAIGNRENDRGPLEVWRDLGIGDRAKPSSGRET